MNGDRVQPAFRSATRRIEPGPALPDVEPDLACDVCTMAPWDPQGPQPAKHGTNLRRAKEARVRGGALVALRRRCSAALIHGSLLPEGSFSGESALPPPSRTRWQSSPPLRHAVAGS